MAELEEFAELYVNGLLSADGMLTVLEALLERDSIRNPPRQLREQFGIFNLDEMAEQEVVRQFRFSKRDLPELLRNLTIPPSVHTGGPNGYRVPGMTALCILLRRLAYPNRLSDLERVFGISQSALSAIANWTTNFIVQEKGHLLTDLNRISWLNTEKLATYAEAVASRGAPLTNCWAFIDGTARRICRPNEDQGLYYSGHKRFHALKYQSIATPDGLIINLQGPYQGRRHDAAFWTGSDVQNQVRRLCVTPARTFVIYGDPAYPTSDILIPPYPSNTQAPHQLVFNRAMSKVRIAVEWGFGKVLQQFAFVDFSKNQKLHLQDLGGMYSVAVLLTNCHTCLYGSQTSEYFGITPPTLENYLSIS